MQWILKWNRRDQESASFFFTIDSNTESSLNPARSLEAWGIRFKSLTGGRVKVMTLLDCGEEDLVITLTCRDSGKEVLLGHSPEPAQCLFTGLCDLTNSSVVRTMNLWQTLQPKYLLIIKSFGTSKWNFTPDLSADGLGSWATLITSAQSVPSQPAWILLDWTSQHKLTRPSLFTFKRLPFLPGRQDRKGVPSQAQTQHLQCYYQYTKSKMPYLPWTIPSLLHWLFHVSLIFLLYYCCWSVPLLGTHVFLVISLFCYV